VPQRFSGLWRHRDFLKLWAAQTVSLFGTQVTALALPLTAVLVLHVSAAQMGLLTALSTLPFLLIGLFAGAWVDRMRRRPILIAADLGRALLFASIPLAAALDRLSIEQLYAVALLTGMLTVFFDVAYQSYLPSLVDRSDLVDGNSKLEISNSVARVSGPGIGGALVQIFSGHLERDRRGSAGGFSPSAASSARRIDGGEQLLQRHRRRRLHPLPDADA
jgi:MFS family permease